MFKFIHIGDVHLDTTFYSKGNNIREKLRNSLRRAFGEVIETCIKEKVHALLIAGDLFDNSHLSFQTEQMLINSFNRLKEHHIKVYYATGNHDPGDEGYRANNIAWPENVTLFATDEISEVEVLNQEGEVVGKVIGVGHKTNKEGRNLVANFPKKAGEIPHVGLVHTMVTNASGVDSHDRYLPCSEEDLLEKGYDYWALGHIHQLQQLGENPIYYSGNLQGRHPKETGGKGGLVVTLNNHRQPKVTFKDFSKVTWHHVTIGDLESFNNYTELKDYIINNLSNYFLQNPTTVEGILRVELEGRSPLKGELQEEENLQQLEEDIKYHFNLLEVEVKTEELLFYQKVEDYIGGENILGKTLELLEGLENDDELINRLLKLPFAHKGLKTTEERFSYIKRLSKGLKEEAVNRMVGDEG